MNINSEKMQAAIRWSPVVRRVISSGGTDEDCIVALVQMNEAITRRLMELEMIAPRMITLGNGMKIRYNCPDEFIPKIPETET